MSRLDLAISLTVAERKAAIREFFSAYPGSAGGGIGLGLAVADFVEWEVRSGRIADHSGGSQWWKAVNGELVLDLIEAGCGDRSAGDSEWIAYSAGTPADQQRLFWDAHGSSIDRGVAMARHLLVKEWKEEQELIEIVLNVLGEAGSNSEPTGDHSLGKAVDRFYPGSYPTRPADLVALRSLFAPHKKITTDVARWETGG